MQWDIEKADNIHRDTFIDAVKAELSGEAGRPDKPLLGNGYIKPLYAMPLFGQSVDLFPNVSSLYRDKLFISMYHSLPLKEIDFQDISDAFHKVWDNRQQLEGYRINKER